MNIWDLIVLSPLINVLVVLSHYLFSSFGLAIIVLTLIVRAAVLPLTLKQLKATKAMQALQPKLQELQKKYARDKNLLAQEQMKLYRESGVSPVGCAVGTFVQIPVWIALLQAITRVLAAVPEDFLSLSQHLYSSWSLVFSIVPLQSKFLWLDLAFPDQYYVLPILVGASMWVSQKMITSPTTDPRQASQNQVMLWMMPIIFAFFTLQFSSGLALYWLISNIVQIGIQYYYTGWGTLVSKPKAPAVAEKVDFLSRPAKIETSVVPAPTSTRTYVSSSACGD